MKKLCLLMCVISMMTSQSAWAIITSTTYNPTPSNLEDLNQFYYYSWNVNTGITDPTEVVGARLTIDNINNWIIEPNDHLRIHMLDDAPNLCDRISPDVTRGFDLTLGGDHFAGQGQLLVDYTDNNEYMQFIEIFPGFSIPIGEVNPAEDLVYDFSQTDLDFLRSYLGDGSVGFTFDPDCQYYNCGISFTLFTNSDPGNPTSPIVPEPMTSALVLLGVGGAAGMRRLRRRLK